MPDGYFDSLPIPRKNVDLAGMQQNIASLQSGLAQEILDRTAADATKANKSTTINGKDLSADRVIYAQDVPSKNLLPNTAYTTKNNGITFTVNADGSVTVNGTATGGNADFNIIATASGALDFLASGDYILSGCPSGGSWNSYNLQVENAGAWVGDNGEGGAFTRSSSGEDRVRIHVATGTTVSNLTFRPMIRLASIEDDSYVPYAMTNIELSPKVIAPTAVVSRVNLNSGYIAKIGKICVINIVLTATASASNSPSCIRDLPLSICDTALSAIDITSGIGTAIASAVPCGMSMDGNLYLKEIVKNHIYAITGTYILA